MSNAPSDGRQRRISDDVQRIFMGRAIERFYGSDAIDLLVADRHEKTRKNWAEKARRLKRSDPGYLKCLFSEHAHEYEILRDDPECLEVKVTKCVHADVFREYNATELGEKLICSGDEAVVAGYNPDMTFRRPSTCMRGDCCHFIFALPADGEADA